MSIRVRPRRVVACAAVALIAAACAHPDADDEGHWRPEQGLTWHIQLQGEATIPPNVDVVEVDPEMVTAEQVADWHDRGIRSICYIDAGSYEEWRLDADLFATELLGKELDDWPGQRWLDVRRLDLLMPIMEARIDRCADMGFDAVDPDDVDGYANDSGFDMTPADSAAYISALSEATRSRGMAFGLKNAAGLIGSPLPVAALDFAVNEQCAEFDECSRYSPLVDAGRPVFAIVYAADCPAPRKGFSFVLAERELNGSTRMCR